MKLALPRMMRADDPSRSPLAIALIVLSLLVLLVVAWQAQRTAVTHLQTATNVLTEYASLVADEYARRAMSEIGYRGYYAYITELQQHFTQTSGSPPRADSSGGARALAAYEFAFDSSSGELQVFGPAATADPAAADIRLLAQRASGVLGPENNFVIEHAIVAGQPQTVVMSVSGGKAVVFGFVVDRAVLGQWLRAAFDADTLLPESLGRGAVTNEFVYLRFADDHNETLFATGNRYDPYLIIDKRLDEEYSGIFRGHVITAAIDPAVAESLVIGGLPRSRLPLLMLLFLLTAGLLIAAIRQLQRERRIAQMRTNFVAEVSHELRTPLTQIRMFAETLLYGRARTEQDRQRAVEIINREAQRLIHLVENVLRFSNDDAHNQPLQIETQRIAPLVEQIVGEFRPLSPRTTINCELHEAAIAPVDADALRQVLLNLLDNAVKYGPAGQTIQVHLSNAAGCVVLSVSDQGPGIPARDRETIWGDFSRLERERGSAVAGTGIGLSVVRALVERHGGRATVEDDDGGGARFVVTLPAPEHSA